ncbi:unnamed protein product [Arabidopsis halleri]
MGGTILRQRSDPLRWTDQVWFKGAIPRRIYDVV